MQLIFVTCTIIYWRLLSLLFQYCHIFLFLSSPQTWRQHKEGDPWPGRRSLHIAACLRYGEQHQRLLISGGVDGVGATFDDMWLMDPQSGRMEKVRTVVEDLFCHSSLRV